MMTLINRDTYVKLKLDEAFQRFCEGTNVHGFSNLGHAKSIFWKVVWWIVIICAIGITVYQIYFSIQQYVYQSSITQALPPEKGNVVYPTMGICYPHWIYWIDWSKANGMGFSNQSILFGLSYMGKIFSATEFNIQDANDSFVETMNKNNITYLTEFYEAIAHNFPMIIGTFPDWPVLQINPSIFKTKQIVFKGDDYYFCYTTSGQEIATTLNGQGTMNISSRLSKGLFNFSFQDPNYNLYKSFISDKEYNYYMAYWLCYNSNYWLVTLEDFSKDFTSFTIPIKLFPDINAEEFVTLKTENDEYNIKMTPTVQRKRNTRYQPCLEKQKAMSTDQQCKIKCKADMDNQNSLCSFIDEAAVDNLDTVKLLCGYPINFLQYQRENPAFEMYPCDNFMPTGPKDTNRRQNMTHAPTMSSQSMSSQSISDEQLRLNYFDCFDKCDTVCEIWKYSITVNVITGSKTAMENSFKNQTNINIFYPLEEDVLIVVDIDAQSWEDFVATVGGLLGVWTGASMISFLQIPYLCCFNGWEMGWDGIFGSSKPEVSRKSKRKKEPGVVLVSTDKRKTIPPNGVVLKVTELNKDATELKVGRSNNRVSELKNEYHEVKTNVAKGHDLN